MWRSTEAVLNSAIRDLTAGNCHKVVEVASINTRFCRQEADDSPTNGSSFFARGCNAFVKRDTFDKPWLRRFRNSMVAILVMHWYVRTKGACNT